MSVKSKLGRIFRDLFVADATECHGDKVEIPEKCSHCELPVHVTMVTDGNDEVVSKSWLCTYCGNGANTDPDRTPAEALERLRRQNEMISHLAEEHLDDN